MYLPTLLIAVGCTHLVQSTAFVLGPSLPAREAPPTHHVRSTTAPSMGSDLRCHGPEKGARRRCRRSPELSRLEAAAASSTSRPPPEVRSEERKSEACLRVLTVPSSGLLVSSLPPCWPSIRGKKIWPLGAHGSALSQRWNTEGIRGVA